MLKEHTSSHLRAFLNHISGQLGKTVMASALSFAFKPSKGYSRLLEWRESILLGFLIAVIGAGLSLTSLGKESEESFGLFWLFALRGPIPAPPEVVVIAIDRASSRQLGLPAMPSLWPRTLHAGLIESLSRAGAKLIAFDLRFDSPGTVPDDDLVHAEAMRKAGHVVIVERLDQEDDLFLDGDDAAYHGSSIEKLAMPIPVIAEAAAAHAAFPLPRASRVNHYWAFRTNAGDARRCLSLLN